MLTAEHVHVRKKDGEIVLRALDARQRTEALALAAAYLDAAREHLGRSRDELSSTWDGIDASARTRRVAAGLRKLVDDACVFEADASGDPVELRRAVFRRASAARRGGAPFDREAILAEIANERSTSADALDRALFADLRGAHVLRGLPSLDASSIVSTYEMGQAQAVLLRAVRVTCDVRAASPGALRAFFAWMKFQKLLFCAEKRDDGSLRVVVDGPFSMFESVTKYGLRLALLLPAMRALDAWSLTADVKWGKEREPVVFRLSSEAFDLAHAKDRREAHEPHAPHLADDVRALLDAIRQQKTPWRVEPASTLLDHPGVGLCIPDLVLERDGAPRVYVEVLGFWSREAVWKRVELVQSGLGAPIVFCASARLRVSAEVLDADAPAALYVYKGKINARALLDRVERVAQASYPPNPPCTSSSPERPAGSAKPSPANT